MSSNPPAPAFVALGDALRLLSETVQLDEHQCAGTLGRVLADLECENRLLYRKPILTKAPLKLCGWTLGHWLMTVADGSADLQDTWEVTVLNQSQRRSVRLLDFEARGDRMQRVVRAAERSLRGATGGRTRQADQFVAWLVRAVYNRLERSGAGATYARLRRWLLENLPASPDDGLEAEEIAALLDEPEYVCAVAITGVHVATTSPSDEALMPTEQLLWVECYRRTGTRERCRSFRTLEDYWRRHQSARLRDNS